MWVQIKPLLINLLIYTVLLIILLLVPLVILLFIFPHQNAAVWLGALGSYLGSVVAVIGTVIITRIQIRTERLDSLNNSIFLERYQMLNELLSHLYNIKSTTWGYLRQIKVIRRYLNNNGRLTGVSKYFQKFLDDFDVDEFANFYNYTSNRLMSQKLNENDLKRVNELIQKLFQNNHQLVFTSIEITRAFNHSLNNDFNDHDLKQKIEHEGQILSITTQLLNQLDAEIQRVIQLSHDEIVNK